MKFSNVTLIVLIVFTTTSYPLFSQHALTSSSNPQSAPVVFTQNDKSFGTYTKFYDNLWAGARMSFNKWDLPLLTACGLTQVQNSGHLASLSHFELDEEVTEHLARTDGKYSLGSLNPVYFPLAAGTARLAGMIVLDAVSSVDYSPASYSRLIQFHKALFYTHILTSFTKRNFPRTRPDGSNNRSFFSGHTSAAFATSTFLYLEAGDFIDHLEHKNGNLPVMSARAWKLFSFGILHGWAGYVGYSRIRDRKHYLSDVIIGAAAGSLISLLVYPHHTSLGNEYGMQLGVQPAASGARLDLKIGF